MKKLVVSIFVLSALFTISCGQPANNSSGIGNPATNYCTQNGGKSEIRTAANGNQTGYCLFDRNGKKSECEEFAFMRGECKPQ